MMGIYVVLENVNNLLGSILVGSNELQCTYEQYCNSVVHTSDDTPRPHFGGHFTLFNSHQQRVTSRVSKHFFLLSTVSSYTKFDFYASL